MTCAMSYVELVLEFWTGNTVPKSLPSVLTVLKPSSITEYEEAESVTRKEPKEIIRCNEPVLSFLVVFYILYRARRCSVAITFTTGKK